MTYVVENIETGQRWLPGIGWQPAGPGFGSWAMARKAADTLAGCGEPARVAEADAAPWGGTVTEFCGPALPQNEPQPRRSRGRDWRDRPAPGEPGELDDLTTPLRPSPSGEPWVLTEEGLEVHRKTMVPRDMNPDPETGLANAWGCLGFVLWLIWSPFFGPRPKKKR